MVAAPETSRETAKRAAEDNVEEKVDGETEKVKKPRMEEPSAKSEEEEQDDDAKEQVDDGANDATAEKGGDGDELATCNYLDLTDAYGKEYRVKRIRSVEEVGQDKFEVKDADSAKIPKLSFFGAGDADDDRLDHFYTHPSLPLIMRIASLEERLMQGENEDFEDIKNEFEAPNNVGGWVVTLWKNAGKEALRSLKRRKAESQREQVEEYKAVIAKRLAGRKSSAAAVKAKKAAARA